MAPADATDRPPVLGRVQAGALNTAVEDLEGYVPVQLSASQDADELFGLKVRGESMRDAGIRPGDVVVVKRQPTARSGEIVVALVEDEATVKRFFRDADEIRLEPENPDYEPIRTREAQILGRVIGVFRKV